MSQGRLTVVARIRARPGMKQRVRRELAALLEPTRAENENWTSAADLDAHLASPHIQRWIRLADELLAEPIEITRWTPVG